MTEQLELVLHKYDLELTIDEQTELVDLITYYCDSNQEWMSSSEDGIKEHKIADQILNLPFSSHHTETITFTSDQIYCINHALNQKEELWSGDDEGFKLGIVDKEGHLIGVLGDIDKKIEEVI
tara:strand:+ start:44 stop:412 length:369 start_codon:yes stop_codon:yes gene_type:complete